MRYPTDEERIRQNLADAGFCGGEISEFLNIGENDARRKIKFLYNHRKKLLENFHSLQREIDCLDFLIAQIQKENGLSF